MKGIKKVWGGGRVNISDTYLSPRKLQLSSPVPSFVLNRDDTISNFEC